MVARFREAPFSDFDAAAGWQDHVHHAQITQFFQNAMQPSAQPRLLAHRVKVVAHAIAVAGSPAANCVVHRRDLGQA